MSVGFCSRQCVLATSDPVARMDQLSLPLGWPLIKMFISLGISMVTLQRQVLKESMVVLELSRSPVYDLSISCSFGLFVDGSFESRQGFLWPSLHLYMVCCHECQNKIMVFQ